MIIKYILSFFVVLLLASCSKYLGDYKDVYYYKYNDIPSKSSYFIVFNDSIDSYSNIKYLKIAENIRNNLNLLGFIEAKSYQQSRYLVYYNYDISNKDNLYTLVLSVKMFDTKNTVDVFNEGSAKVLKKDKMIFDASSVLYTSSYMPNQNANCLVNAIFKTQIMSDTKTIHIKSKISKEEADIKTQEGSYYCLGSK